MAGNNSGNRQDNRQRGNAAQLHEKYKSLARDSQLAGDRVQTEYYLQFADHYFRLLGENRPRFDEQRPRNADDDNDQDDDGDDRMDSDMDGDGESGSDSNDRSDQQRMRTDDSAQRRPRPTADRGAGNPRRDRPNGRARDDDDGRDRPSAREESGERIDSAVLPPASGGDRAGKDAADHDDAEAPRPRRRVRAPKAAELSSDDSPGA